MNATPTIDGRRTAGERTRRRLLDATRSLLAERGEEAVTLREITGAAQANVAAVSYHFGSLSALCREAIEQSLSTLVDEQVERLGELGEDATLEEIATALARPVITAVMDADCAERAFLRILARVAARPRGEREEWMEATLARSDAAVLPHLRRALPGVGDDELHFRRECAFGILHFLASGSMRVDLDRLSAGELERLFVPVIGGALAAGAA